MNINIENLSTKEILDHYNTIATRVGLKTVKRFSDRKAAVRRLTKLITEHGTDVKVSKEEVLANETKDTRPVVEKQSRRRVGFNFPPKYDVPKKVREDSLRAQAIDLLKGGAHFGEVMNLCQEWHTKQGIPPRNIERRAYELIRLINHYVGYGLREKGDLIYCYTKQQELDV